MKIKMCAFLCAFGLFSTAYAYQGYDNRPESYFYVKNGKVSKRVAKTGGGMWQGYLAASWRFKNGKTLRVEEPTEGIGGKFEGMKKSTLENLASWTINDKEVIRVKRPKGVPKGYKCVREQSNKTEIYCVKW